MKASIIAPHEIDSEHQRCWNRIRKDNSALASPFFAPEFTRAVGTLRSDARVAVIEDGAQIVGFFPFHRRTLGFGRSIGLGMNDFHGLICASDADIDSTWLLRTCRLRLWTTDHLINQQAGLLTSINGAHESPYIKCPAGLLPYTQQMKSERRPGVERALRKRGRLINAFGSELRFVWHSVSESSLERLITLKSAQCREAGSYDYTRHNWIRRLLFGLLAHQSKDFGGVLSELRVGERTIAMHFGMRSDNRLHWWLPAYERQWQSWSPGLVLLLDVIEQSHQHGIHQIDLGRDLSRYKREFMNGMDILHNGAISVDAKSAAALALTSRIAQLDQNSTTLSRFLRPIAGAMRVSNRRLNFQ